MRSPASSRTAALLLLASSVAFAQAKPKSLAEELKGGALESFEQAKDLFDHGDYETSHAKYTQAYEASKNPRLLWNMAACSARRKRYAQATVEAEKYLADGRSVLTKEQIARANEALSDWRAFVATATLTFSVPGATVLVDKEPVAVEGVEKAVLLDMGTHEVQATKAGYEPFRDTIVVKNVGKIAFPITLKAVAPAAAPAPAAPPQVVVVTPAAAPAAPATQAAPLAKEPAPPPSTSTTTVLGWTSVGLGVAALAGGGFMHMQAKSAADDFRAQCIDTACKAGAAGLYDDYASKSTLASALYVSGGVLALAGGVMVWLGGRGTEPAPRALRLEVGPSTVSFGGSF
jgi:hypothetical protein